MRVSTLRQAGDEAQAQELAGFAAFLKRVGQGTEQEYPAVGESMIRIPPGMWCGAGGGASVGDLIEEVYGGVRGLEGEARAEHIIERAILTPLNQHVDAINKQMMEWMSTFDEGVEQREYLSADGTVGVETQGLYPTEFLNSLCFSGVPPHKLLLRVGCPIILLRNLTGGLANGTRLIVTRLGDRVIEAKVATGPSKGDVVCIPRLGITPSDTNMPFTLRRLQFHVRPAFAMTVNKSQGQTLQMVGVYLPKAVFSHGQLYVALSRVGRMQAVRVLVEDGWVNEGEFDGVPEGMYTANVVYREVLT
jgi:ATP-dependent DNA helicase PIF1